MFLWKWHQLQQNCTYISTKKNVIQKETATLKDFLIEKNLLSKRNPVEYFNWRFGYRQELFYHHCLGADVDEERRKKLWWHVGLTCGSTLALLVFHSVALTVKMAALVAVVLSEGLTLSFRSSSHSVRWCSICGIRCCWWWLWGCLNNEMLWWFK